MKIEASQISYETEHRAANVTLTMDEIIARRPISGTNQAAGSPTKAPAGPMDSVQLSALGGLSMGSNYDDLKDLDPKQRMAWLILQAVLGQKINLMHSSSSAAPTSSNAPPAGGAGEVHREIVLHSEMEQTSFQAQGMVETADGRRIQFSAKLSMEWAFQSASATTRSVSTTDPLVVNLGGAPARISGAKIAFDLNSDGTLESVSFVAGGSGFLAVDSNGDGKVNDGRELFGPQTGNGFAELASYDADGNSWIDENDPIFSKLRIWTQDGVSTLAENGIGAISTNSASTPFALKDNANHLQANIRATGTYLSESGAAGTIQQVDLADA